MLVPRALISFLALLAAFWPVSVFLLITDMPAEAAVPEKTGPFTYRGTITDFEARLALARVLSFSDGTLEEALNEYRALAALYPENASVRAEMARVLLWLGKRDEALRELRLALSEEPSNKEALYRWGQAQCLSGLHAASVGAYEKLLAEGPSHDQSNYQSNYQSNEAGGDALEGAKLALRPRAEAAYSYWSERGRDELSGISRGRMDTGISAPLYKDIRAGLSALYLDERAHFNNKTFTARGFKVHVEGAVNRRLKGGASWTLKSYSGEPGDTGTGSVHFDLYLRDGLRLGGRHEKTDEFYNLFGLRQGVQARSYMLRAEADPARRVGLEAGAGYSRYSDENRGKHVFLSAGYAFGAHPVKLKLALSGEYRDTDKKSVSIFEEERLKDIVHPYWTPQNYYAGAVSIEWGGDYGEGFCEAKKRSYGLKLSLGTDSEQNPPFFKMLIFRLEGEWTHEFERFGAGMRFLLHRSPLWDANALWVDLRYIF